MSSIDQIKQKLDELTRRYGTASKKRAEFQGQLQAKKQELMTLKAEIEAAGFDPKNLKKERDALETELVTLLSTFEKELAEVEAALAAFDKR